MKFAITIIAACCFHLSFAQGYQSSAIDWRVRSIDAPNVDSLARLLVEPYRTDLEKARAIFSWIAQHVSYNTYIIPSNRKYRGSKYVAEPDDTTFLWRSVAEMTAIKVFRKRTAVCDGYAKLFKTLCDYAGLRSEVIVGYARGYVTGENRFRTNHTWNAVLIDSTWNLVDVTWASGYINYADQFVPRLDDSYFRTPPHVFIRDHYPEDLEWTLLEEPPAIAEFRRMPYRCKSYVKYGIHSYSPSQGLIEAGVGDTVRIEVKMKDVIRDKSISPDPFFDSAAMDRSPFTAFLSPADTIGGTFRYTYVVRENPAQWLNVTYNKDVIMGYRLSLKKDMAFVKKEE